MPSDAKLKPDSEPTSDLVQLARETAYDRYIQALLVKPPKLHADFLILAAFHGELARIPLLVREPMMGEIRLQWWHDVISATEYMSDAADSNFGSPLANRVADLIARLPSTRSLFLSAIDARRLEFGDHAFATQSDFEHYMDGIGCALFGVGLQVLGVKLSSLETKALQAAGRAVACAELALRAGRLSELGRLPHIPGNSSEDDTAEVSHVAEGYTQLRLSDTITTLSKTAMVSLKDYRELQHDLSTQMTHAVLPLALVEPYFKALQKASSIDLRAQPPRSPLARFVTLWWAAKRKRF